MAAYSAVVALEQLLNQLLNSDQFPKEEVVSLREKISSLRSSLEKIFPAPKRDRVEANRLEGRIRETIFEAQDKIESFIFSTQNHPPETSKSQSLISFSLWKIVAVIDPIVEDAKRLGDSIQKGKKNTRLDLVEESLYYKVSRIVRRNRPVGQEVYKAEIEKKLLAKTGSRLVIPICGLPGIGKTTLAKSIYEDVHFMKSFQYRAWVTVSQDANVEDIFGKLLHSLESRGQKAGDLKYEGDEAKLRVCLHFALSNNKYLVVIDDLWDPEVWMRLKTALPDNENSSRVLVTTRILKVAEFIKDTDGIEMEPLNDEDSWTLLRNKTLGDDTECPANLVSLGRKIARHSFGIPLSLTAMGGLLSHMCKEPECWQTIEEDVSGATANAYVDDAYYEILSLSYEYLPSKLKACFLYMAAFPRGSDIPVSKLIMLWVAEGFLTIPPPRPLPQLQLIDWYEELSLGVSLAVPKPLPLPVEEVAEKSLLDLIDRNLVMIRKKGSDGRIKYCGMHESLRDLAEKESRRDKFFHIRTRYLQRTEDNTEFQRRVSVHKNVLMCFEEVYNPTKNITNARSLLYSGPHGHHHPMRFKFTFDLLRVLDAFSVFFIEFPNEILELIHLRYLSFTYNGKLPSEIAKLHKLQVLIVKRQPKIIFVGMSFLPDEIWGMKELRHLLMTETDLPINLPPTEDGTTILFENLQTLTNINADSVTTEKVLKHAPNLKRLGMWMEGPKKLEFHMDRLDQLKIFKFTVLKPILVPTPDFQPKFYFPNTLIKLNLSGTGLPWEDMEAIAALPNLQVLKLKELAFHGEEWLPSHNFVNLKFLLIEYLNLKRWEAKYSQFPRLEQLIIRHCYEVEELPLDFTDVENLRLIELVDCSPEAVKWAEDIIEMVEGYGYKNPHVRIISSLE